MKIVDHLVDPTLDGFHVYRRWMNLSFLWHISRRRPVVVLFLSCAFWRNIRNYLRRGFWPFVFFHEEDFGQLFYYLRRGSSTFEHFVIHLFIYFKLSFDIWLVISVYHRNFVLTSYVWFLFHILQILRTLLNFPYCEQPLFWNFVKTISVYIRNFKILWSRGGLYWLY